MSDQPILFCLQCNHVCKSLRGLAQHITHRRACCQKSLPILDGITIQKPTVHQSFVQLDAPYADEAMEPIWQQNNDPDTFDAPQPCPDAAHINCESETPQFVYHHRNQLDNHISCQLTDNGLVDSSTMLDTEDRQDIMLDTDESFAFQEDEVIMDACTPLFDVDNEDDSLQFTDRLRGQHTAKEIMSLKLLKSLRLAGALHHAYGSIMDIFADALASKVVTASATFRSHDTAIKHFANRSRLDKLYPTTLTKHMNGRSYPVVLHDAEVMVQSLLKSSLMIQENMLFPDMDNPLPPPPLTVETIGADVDRGHVFRSTHGHLCTQPNDVLCPLIMYLDRICIDQHRRCSLEPGYATLGIWNVATRNKVEAWRPLGYIPNIYLLSKNENKFRMNSLKKL
jgi:hypothetical protein